MSEIVNIRISPSHVDNQAVWKKIIARARHIDATRITDMRLLKRSIDARGKHPKYQMRIEVFLDNEKVQANISTHLYPNIDGKKRVVIIGAGPCGYFAALRCIENGLCPVVVDRGKDVQSRRRDLRQIQQFHIVNPDSNYCFGEGGAGTYSDGKLYTRSVKRGNVRKMLEVLVQHGAKSDILIDAHPHIGSNKLPQVVANIRETILESGGEIHFNKRVVDFVIRLGRVQGIICSDNSEFTGEATILCTGHSARDIYNLCQQKGVNLEFKPFAMGMRLEHPQSLIDEIQYNHDKGEYLPAASYSLSCQVDDHGVFSFCMCPGGLIVPAATAPGEIVVNGMSLSRRDSPFANAATVVTIDQNPEVDNPFGGVNFQQQLEQAFFKNGDGSQTAPAQRMMDFMEGKLSASLPDTSYIPGIYPAELHEMLPGNIVEKIRKAMKIFDKRMKGYLTNEAQFVGLESRTSAPIRIPRDKDSLMNKDVTGLFPAGEGAGYAGGILSAALDGERVANAVHQFFQ